MTETEFLESIARCPDDKDLYDSYVDWLVSQGDARGKYARLRRRQESLQEEMDVLESELDRYAGQIDMDWLDLMFPVEIKSPMVGRYYATPSPDSPPYVIPGDFVSEDTIVCLIGAMTVFYEIKAGVRGTVLALLIQPGEAVEFGQPLFRVKRLAPIAGG
ncbi:MAG: biotin/lipoyl-containing protein [Phycisphaeraceae bacterium]